MHIKYVRNTAAKGDNSIKDWRETPAKMPIISRTELEFFLLYFTNENEYSPSINKQYRYNTRGNTENKLWPSPFSFASPVHLKLGDNPKFSFFLSIYRHYVLLKISRIHTHAYTNHPRSILDPISNISIYIPS